MYIGGQGKLGYIKGHVTVPSMSDTQTYDRCESENLTVMSRLLNSMQHQISRGFLFLRTTKEVWDSAAQTYSHVKNFV